MSSYALLLFPIIKGFVIFSTSEYTNMFCLLQDCVLHLPRKHGWHLITKIYARYDKLRSKANVSHVFGYL